MSGLNISPDLQDVYDVLQPFLMTVTGLSSSLVVQGLPNRTAMPPASPGFVSMQATLTKRLRTNVHEGWIGVVDPSTIDVEQGTLLRVQLDFYGAASGDWAAATSTLLRDEYGCVALAGGPDAAPPPVCQPLYADDPRLAPLVDDEAQYEHRWIVEAFLQYNPVTTTPMQFADAASVTVINVDERYTP